MGQRTLTVQREVQVGNLTIGAEDLVQVILIDVLGKALDDDLLNEPLVNYSASYMADYKVSLWRGTGGGL